MPTYDYECKGCGHRFETFQSIKDGALRKCPKCGKLKLNRLIGTGGGFLFKGSGFYITDYRSSSYKEKAKSDSGTGGSESAKSSDGAASTPAKKEKADAPAPKPASKKDAPAPAKKSGGGKSGS